MDVPLRTVTEYEVPVPVRDGTVLRATVTRPEAPGPVPVLLMRTPYPVQDVRLDVDVAAVVRRGLALVCVANRGTGASDGVFEPWADDARDGADVIDWCAAQAWCTGDVVTYGRSYLAQTQLFAAGERPPALRAMGLGVCPGDPYDVVHHGGAMLAGSGVGWAVGQTGLALARGVARGEVSSGVVRAWRELPGEVGEVLRGGEAVAVPFDAGMPSWRGWLEHPARDGWWARRALPDRDPVPSFYVGGWHDIFVRGTVEQFMRSRHPGSTLVVGPWGHGPGGAALGEARYGPRADARALGLDEEILGFLASYARGEVPGTAEDAPVRLYLMGADVWVRTTDWPHPAAVDHRYHLHPDGTLAVHEPAPGASGDVGFVHDPADPVPTVGGPNIFAHGDAAYGTGAWDQGARAARPDVVSFESGVLSEDVDVVGTVRLSLVVSTTARDADWCATLVDVHPDGRALNVVDGVVRARFSGSDATESLLEPGVPHRVEVELGPTAQRFGAGHRIRVDVSGSNHPRFDVNPGTGLPWSRTAPGEHVVSHQTVHLGAASPSYLTLPVLPAHPMEEEL
ncbi:CocE/NonD family hydrolase [Cellulomonas bogoriensis]|uniref:X-Pro dipeptidyl-peptidase n=1 Tax=Cellulomonas bogoriensis 69B4 = DSM 16987 TaxID=1386082 RepID=A0A0A0BZ62_9CELL|nr:CocE/NonD family hydrolase [Cellulomonas bogoriensis]KGM13683.1 X-Pro dipeptidyl-peptidase [Cellulomonas bogoriensis 69B4 = DSM 16987]